ncbi:Class II abasic (AP) endonuclease [Recurvomyces mirabilis]|uniref:DNA-(apurinic or apyrimidinic site) endonuclease 2 n=1 Tax=Recurvomyces mirabilis TaxID=574656 RepID=A0AAE0WMA2_9PEZI|nr:Class II abasic (AP) endonuclease [Recurvomyces mirabilis]KAK5154157.1 Class II abasic (AP) endonuclease [Recurvomyces mirabilis]
MRLTTWNVNGVRNPFGYQPWNTARTFPAMFDILGSDIVVMQELKIQRKDLRDDMVILDGWDCYFSLPKHKKGYSGVGIYTRNATCAPIKAEEGLLGVLPSPSGVPYCDLMDEEHIGGYPNALQVAELGVDPVLLDSEGRCMVLEFPAFVLFGVYSPANSNGLRDDFRYGFICALDCRIRNLIKAGKRVILVGDLNVSRDENDTASALEDMRKAGIVHEDYISTPNRRIFNQLLEGGEVIGERDEGREDAILWDTTRAFHPDRKGMYTHWEQKINARPGNFGSRIDFVLVSRAMQSWIKDANIMEGLLGSDHCPVFADFNDDVEVDGARVKLADLMSPARVFDNGIRQKEWNVTEVPAFSAKRLPEFDKRRSIKSMFAAPSVKRAASSMASEATPDCPTPSEEAFDKTDGTPEAKPDLVDEKQTSDHIINGTGTATLPKRKASTPAKTIPAKRQKSDGPSLGTKGQQSLKGFFRKSAASKPNTLGAGTHLEGDAQADIIKPESTPILNHRPSTPPPADGREPADSSSHEQANTTTPRTDFGSPSSAVTLSPAQFGARVAAAEQNQRSWGNLFSRPIAPMCEGHTEPCKTMLTKKKGSNQGRSFWMCARPLGPSGSKEKGTQWRCATFIWCSDWQSRKAEEKRLENG